MPETNPSAAEDQRVPYPPRQRGGLKLLLMLATVLLLGAGLIFTGSLLTTGRPTELGLIILGVVIVVPTGLAVAWFTPTLWFGWRNRPAAEICWWPLRSGQTTTSTFVAGRARFHGLWLCLDVNYPFERGPHYVVSTFEVLVEGRTLAAEQVATGWGFPGDPTGGTRMFVGKKVAPGLGVALSELELHRVVDARPTGRFRALSLLHRIRGLRPGQQVTVNLTIQAPAIATELHAHAFVALSP